jgi:peptidyl-prolyl cis-trans isomerase SurA
LVKIRFFAAIIGLFVSFVCYGQQQQEGDRVIAIVGNDIITESDLRNQLVQYARQNNLTEVSDAVIQTVFQGLLFDKLVLAKADQDSITITDDEVQKQLDYQVKSLVQKFGSEKNLEEAYGGTLNKLKESFRDQIKKRLKIDKVKQEKFGGGITVTKPEVRQFFEQFKDSIPPVTETYDLFEIVRTPKLTEEAKKIAYDKAKVILDSLKMGGDFSDFARRYSDDSASAVLGGDLGKAKKGTFVKPFEDAAYLLKPGEMSDIVETEFGYHIIKLVEKTGDAIHLQHILIKYPHTESADFEEINFLKDLKTKINSGQLTFKQAAVLYSQDKESAADSGYIGKVSLNNLDSLEIMALSKLQPRELTEPIRVGDNKNYGYYMYFVQSKIPEHKATLETDYDLLEKYALNIKEQKLQSEWFEELKKTIYIETKI